VLTKEGKGDNGEDKQSVKGKVTDIKEDSRWISPGE
jgi:hypothetical protein